MADMAEIICGICFFGGIIVFVIGMAFGDSNATKRIQKEAVESGAGYYEPLSDGTTKFHFRKIKLIKSFANSDRL